MLAYDADAPDPFLLRVGTTFWAYTTGSAGLDLQVLRAPAPTGPWQLLGDPLAALPAWAVRGRTWSPSVLATADGLVLYAAVHERASGRQVLATFTGSDPAGPFIPVGGPLVRQLHHGGAIDPDPFVDADGTAVLTWKSDDNAVGRPSSLWGRQLRPDGLDFAGGVIGGRARRLLRHDADWERPLIEAPCLAADGAGGYLLLYSGGEWQGPGYGIGWAAGGSPLGGFSRRTTDGPWLGAGATLAGPGGQALVTDAAGRVWLAFHAWEPDRVGYPAGGRRALHVVGVDLTPAGPVLR